MTRNFSHVHANYMTRPLKAVFDDSSIDNVSVIFLKVYGDGELGLGSFRFIFITRRIRNVIAT